MYVYCCIDLLFYTDRQTHVAKSTVALLKLFIEKFFCFLKDNLNYINNTDKKVRLNRCVSNHHKYEEAQTIL